MCEIPPPRVLRTEIGDEDAIAEAVIRLRARLSDDVYKVQAEKQKQFGRKRTVWLVTLDDESQQRWDRWEAGSRGPKHSDPSAGKKKEKPVVNLAWSQRRCLQLALYHAKMVSASCLMSNATTW